MLEGRTFEFFAVEQLREGEQVTIEDHGEVRSCGVNDFTIGVVRGDERGNLVLDTQDRGNLGRHLPVCKCGLAGRCNGAGLPAQGYPCVWVR